MFPFVKSHIVLVRNVYHNMLQGKGPKTGILTSIVFHKMPNIDFDFAAISVIVCEGGGGGMDAIFSPILQHSFQFVFHKSDQSLL
jgi:hypothetical protein